MNIVCSLLAYVNLTSVMFDPYLNIDDFARHNVSMGQMGVDDKERGSEKSTRKGYNSKYRPPMGGLVLANLKS